MRHLRTIAIFGASLTAAVVLVIGVPWFLATSIGWPLPNTVPSLGQIGDVLGRGGASDETVMKTFAVIAWLAWAHVVWIFTAELLAALRHSVPNIARSTALTHRMVRPIVNGLIFTSTTLGVVANPLAAMATTDAPSVSMDVGLANYVANLATAEATPNTAHTLTYDIDTIQTIEGMDFNETDTPAVAELVPYQVRKGDNLWDLAEHHLGDPFRWRELWDESNELDQLVGTMKDPNLIYPDWIILFPADAVNLPAADPVLVEAVLGTPVPAVVEVAPEPVPAPEPIPEPVQETLPPVTVPAPVVVPETVPAPVATTAEVTTTIDTTRTALAFGGVVAAAGVLAALWRRRRHRAAELEPGTVPEELDPEDSDTEAALRETASSTLDTEWVWAALADIAVEEPIGARPILAEVTDTTMDLAFTGPAVPAEGSSWVANPDTGNEMWTMARSTPAEELADPSDGVVYTMVEIGEGYLVDLEAAGVLSLEGPTSVSQALVRSLIHQLAYSPLAPRLDVRVATPIAGTTGLGCKTEDDLGVLVGEITDWLDSVSDLIATSEAGHGSSFARRSNPTDAQDVIPMIVIANGAEFVAYPEVIAKAKDPAYPLALVLLGEGVDTSYRLEQAAADEIAILWPWKLQMHPNQLSVDEAERISQLLESATTTPAIPLDGSTLMPVPGVVSVGTEPEVAASNGVSSSISDPGMNGHGEVSETMVWSSDTHVGEALAGSVNGSQACSNDAGIELSVSQDSVESGTQTQPVSVLEEDMSHNDSGESPAAEIPAVVVGEDSEQDSEPVTQTVTGGAAEPVAEEANSPVVDIAAGDSSLVPLHPDDADDLDESSIVDSDLDPDRDPDRDPEGALSVPQDTTGTGDDGTGTGDDDTKLTNDAAEGVDDGSNLRLNLLGDISMLDVQGEALTPQQLSAVTILKVRGTLTKEAFIHDLWGGRATTDSRFSGVLTELRTRLGRHRVPESQDGRYYLEGVTTDLDEFDDLVIKAAVAETAGAKIALLGQALGLVTGEPLGRSSKKSWEWLDADHVLGTRVDSSILKAAQDLIDVHIELQDWPGVLKAAGVGNHASPLNKAMVMALVRAHKEMGNIGMAERVVRAWEMSISQLGVGDPDDAPRLLLAPA